MLQLDLHLSSRQDSWLFAGTSLANAFDTYVFDIVDSVQSALGKDYAVSSAVEPGASDMSFPTLGPLDDSSPMRLLGRQEGATAGGAAWSFVTKDQSIYAFWKTAVSILDTYDKL